MSKIHKKQEKKIEEEFHEIESDSDNEYAKQSYAKQSDEINNDEDLFENYVTPLHKLNKHTKYVLFSSSGLHLLKPWALQREINNDHVEELFKNMLDSFKKNNELDFYNPIHIGYKKYSNDEDDNPYFILDGQHRIEAYKRLIKIEDIPIQKIIMSIHDINSEEHFLELFDKINKSLQINRKKLLQEKLIYIKKLLDKKYNKINIWKTLRRPYLDFQKFSTEYRIVNEELEEYHQELSPEEIVKRIIIYNNNIKSIPLRKDRVPKKQSNQISSNIHEKAESMNFFLGLDNEYQWIKQLFTPDMDARCLLQQ